MCYIYHVFYRSNIADNLKAKLKAGWLVAALLLSFFFIFGYVSRPVTVKKPGVSGRTFTSPANVKAALNYKRALQIFRKGRPAIAFAAKPKNTPQQILAKRCSTSYAVLAVSFTSFKQMLAYPVRHLSLTADNS